MINCHSRLVTDTIEEGYRSFKKQDEAMNEKNMREFLDKRPFLPLRITLSSGQVVTVEHPENVLVTKTKLVVVYPKEDIVSVSPLLNVADVEYVEMIEAN